MSPQRKLTAVQTRTGALACQLVFGTPERVVAGPRGPVALFGPGRVVAYQLVNGRRSKVWLFRTLDHELRERARIPGVFPGARLLLETRTQIRTRRLTALLQALQARGHVIDALSDAFFIRVAARLETRAASLRALLHLLAP